MYSINDIWFVVVVRIYDGGYFVGEWNSSWFNKGFEICEFNFFKFYILFFLNIKLYVVLFWY